jgi:hypothetical protein
LPGTGASVAAVEKGSVARATGFEERWSAVFGWGNAAAAAAVFRLV